MPVIADSVSLFPLEGSHGVEIQRQPRRFRPRRLPLLLALFMAALLTLDAEAARKRKRAARPRSRPAPHHRAPAVRPPAKPAQPAEPKERVEAFRDLPEGAEFYHPADDDRKLYPLKKISATHAQPLATPGTGPAEPIPIPGELKVIVRKSPTEKAVTKKPKSKRRR